MTKSLQKERNLYTKAQIQGEHRVMEDRDGNDAVDSKGLLRTDDSIHQKLGRGKKQFYPELCRDHNSPLIS
jgi:hypothetical protein